MPVVLRVRIDVIAVADDGSVEWIKGAITEQDG
jgi:Holliday junction resolvase-like predicted endonuclease